MADETPRPRTYPHGATCWVDTAQPDVAAARRFYGDLLGWQFPDPGDDGYQMATIDGRDVAAIRPSPDGDAVWGTYVAVDDADVTAKAVTSLGGRVVAPPRDMGPAGRGALCADPDGARFHLWQAAGHHGAQYVNDVGGWVFSDLWSANREGSLAFYGELFGWVGVGLDDWVMVQLPGYGEHLAATSDPDIFTRQDGGPENFVDVTAGLTTVPPADAGRWHVSFAVLDRDAAAATAERLGATVLSTTEDTWTRQVLIRDPQGAQLSLSQYSPPEEFTS